MTPDEMNIEQIIPYLEEHGQHFTCDHNSNFDQSVCERAIYFLKQLQAELAKLKKGGKWTYCKVHRTIYYDSIIGNGACPLCLQADNKRLREALMKYGNHFEACPCYIPSGGWKDNHHHTVTEDEVDKVVLPDGNTFTTLKCTCGLEQVLKE